MFSIRYRKMKNAQVLPVVVGITLCTASAALFYKWYKTHYVQQDETDGRPRPRKAKHQSKVTKVNVTIEKDKLQLVMGRAGANIKAIEERTGAKITFRDKDGQNQICEITGPYESAIQAAGAINDEIKRSHCVTDSVIIAKEIHDKVSKVLRDVCLQTGTKIHIDGGYENKTQRKLVITGPFLKVQTARRLIEKEEQQYRNDLEIESKREPRHSQRNSPINSSMESLSKQSCNSP